MLCCKEKRYLIVFLVLIISILSACIHKEELDRIEKYTLKEEEIKYKGYLLPIEKKIFNIDPSNLIVSNGEFVEANEIIMPMSEKIHSEINELEKKKQQLRTEIINIDKDISEIKNGNYAISSEISIEVSGLEESIQSLEGTIQELEISLEETKYNYELEKNNYNRNIEQNNTDIEMLKKELEKLKKEEPTDSLDTRMTNAENELKSLESNNEELKANLTALVQTYKYNEEKTRQSIHDMSGNVEKYEKIKKDILSGNVDNPTIQTIVKQLEEEKKLKEENINDIEKSINSYEEEYFVTAPFVGQIEISNGIVTLYGTEHQFIFNATENQVEELENLENLKLEYKTEIIGDIKLNSITYNEQLSLEGQMSIYSMTYGINSTTNFEAMRNATANMVYKKGIIIPEEYIQKESNKYYVTVNGKKREVKIKMINNQFILIEGAKKGDKIERIVNN